MLEKDIANVKADTSKELARQASVALKKAGSASTTMMEPIKKAIRELAKWVDKKADR